MLLHQCAYDKLGLETLTLKHFKYSTGLANQTLILVNKINLIIQPQQFLVGKTF